MVSFAEMAPSHRGHGLPSSLSPFFDGFPKYNSVDFLDENNIKHSNNTASTRLGADTENTDSRLETADKSDLLIS